MKSKFGGLILLAALSSAAMMLGYTQYAPKPTQVRVEPTPVQSTERKEAAESRRRDRDELKRPERHDVEARPSVKPEVAQEVTLYVSHVSGEEFKLMPVRQKVAEATPLAALKALASYDGPEDPVLPKGTKVLGVKVEDSGLATADFSHEIVDNFPGGSGTEQRLLASIVNTLTQFRSVRRVSITVDGKPVESIGGHIELDEPLTRDLVASQGEER